MSNYLDSVKKRRSYYALGKDVEVADAKIIELVSDSITYAPSAFNSQSSRAIIALHDYHDKVWDIVINTLRKMVASENFSATEAKIETFKSAYGTVLFFEDSSVIEMLQNNFASYSAMFPLWSEQGSGIAQIITWTALEEIGLGVNLQHYNPIIDAEIKKLFSVPDSWVLKSQMVLGSIKQIPEEKDKMDINERVKIFK